VQTVTFQQHYGAKLLPAGRGSGRTLPQLSAEPVVL